MKTFCILIGYTFTVRPDDPVYALHWLRPCSATRSYPLAKPEIGCLKVEKAV